jgi:hypothetical protein
VIQQASHCGGHQVWPARRDQQAGLAGYDDVGHGIYRGRDHGNAADHGLHDGRGQSLVPAGQGEDVKGREHLGDVGAVAGQNHRGDRLGVARIPYSRNNDSPGIWLAFPPPHANVTTVRPAVGRADWVTGVPESVAARAVTALISAVPAATNMRTRITAVLLIRCILTATPERALPWPLAATGHDALTSR